MNTDFIIVGAGSAGCALAYRLSEDPNNRVLVVEAGVGDYGPFIQMPAALSYPMNMSRYDWGYQSEPEPHLGGRRLVVPRGKVIGGSSSINGMVYVRGNPLDYAQWEAAGAKGWNFADVLPYFLRMESWHGSDEPSLSKWRGSSGPLHVTRGPRENSLYHAFVEAGVQAGYGETPDYNGYRQEGFGPMEQTVWMGRRWSASNAYLKAALKRPNCSLIRGQAKRVLFDGKTANAVEINIGGSIRKLSVNREIILAASSLNSPKLLMQSGIGPAENLQECNINVIADRPGVGKNLMDHLELYIQFASKQPITLARHWNPLSKLLIGAQWLLTKTGHGATNHFESAGFIRSRAGIEYPDIQYHFLPLAVRYDGKTAVSGHSFQVHVGPMRSPSRGSVTLDPSEPDSAPRILFNYMSHEQDWQDFRTAIRLTREVFAQPAMQEHVKYEIQPGEESQSDADLNDFIREHVESAYHPCGTVRMGSPDDPMSVVDPQCRVIGVDRLRVVDSSIFPTIPNGNLNAPSIMVGEKASDLILGKTPLNPDDRPFWRAENWMTAQR